MKITAKTHPIVATKGTTCSEKRCGRKVYWDPFIRSWSTRGEAVLKSTPAVAIRCAFCLRVFCLACAHKHFKVENEERFAALVAKRVVAAAMVERVRREMGL